MSKEEKQIDGQLTFEFEQRPTIKGFPELRWTGKRPYRSTQYYPAQLRESYGGGVQMFGSISSFGAITFR